MKTNLIILFAVCLISVGTFLGQSTKKQKVVQGKICGNPNIKCKTRESVFADWDIQFELPENYVIYESETFYAVILKSQKITDRFGGETTCKPVATETERLDIQTLFPNNKVFAQTCGYGPTNYSEDTVFLAVFAGKTLAQAKSFLKVVNKNGKFKDAYIKKLQVDLNGT